LTYIAQPSSGGPVKRTIIAALFVFTNAGLAAGYDDFASAANANVRGEFQAAITGFTAALQAGDLAPGYVPVAYRLRAIAYARLHKCQDASTDLKASAALKPLDHSGQLFEAELKACLGDGAGAQKEFDDVSGADVDAYRLASFGRLQWSFGNFQQASADLLKAADTANKKYKIAAYFALWYAMTADRVGQLDHAHLTSLADSLNSSNWPRPLIDVYLGTAKPESAVAAAGSGQSADDIGRRCEADFYIAEWQIARGDTQAAKTLIGTAMAGCPKSFIEYQLAREEAPRLGLEPPKE